MLWRPKVALIKSIKGLIHYRGVDNELLGMWRGHWIEYRVINVKLICESYRVVSRLVVAKVVFLLLM